MSISLVQLLKIKNLYVRYPNSTKWILDGINLNIDAGEKVALVGPSGCGKSTLAKVILQLMPKESLCEGELWLQDQDPRLLIKEELRRMRGETVGLIFQDPMTRLNPLLSVGEHLKDTIKNHYPKSRKSWLHSQSLELLEKVGISPTRISAFPHELSGGMRQRLAIAMAIALKPQLLIADEPTTSLDVVIADQIMTEITSLCNQLGSTLLLISHDLALAGKWCNRMILLNEGKVIEDQPSLNLLTKPTSYIGKKLLNSAREKEGERTKDTSSKPIIMEIDNLRCWHSIGGTIWNSKWEKAVNGITFNLLAGECLGIVGLSGCGKSTLCRALIGLNKIRGGQIKLQGSNLSKLKGNQLKITRLSIQMVFQDPFACLNPKMTIGAAISDPLLIHSILSKANAARRAHELLEQVGLQPSENYYTKFPNELSGGQQQRVAIARALALNPKVLICDESVSMLDAQAQAEILALLRKLQEDLELAIIFITHDLSVASGFCHRVIILHNGQIIEEGLASDLLNSPNTSLTKNLLKACPRLPKFSSDANF